MNTVDNILDLEKIRADFPALQRRIGDYPLAYLDNTAATLKPQQVIDAVSEFYANRPANVHRGIHLLSEEATDAYESARSRIASFINAPDANELVFTRNATESINLIAQCFAEPMLGPSDEILTTVAEHHANLIPWQQLAARTGAKVKYAAVEPSGRIDIADLEAKLSERTKILSFAHVSNVLGIERPVEKLSSMARRHGAYVVLDAAQSVPHMPVDVQQLGCDFLAFSSYKLLGPFGVGALWGRAELLERMPPYQTGGSMIHTVTLEKTTFAAPPQRFEAGTPAVADAVGFAAAVDYLMSIGMDRVQQQEINLSEYLHQRLLTVPGLRLLGDYYPGKPGIASFDLPYAHAHDVAQFLNEEGVAVRAGHHCAEPLHHEFNSESSTRASLYVYNTKQDIDQLMNALATVTEIFA